MEEWKLTRKSIFFQTVFSSMILVIIKNGYALKTSLESFGLHATKVTSKSLTKIAESIEHEKKKKKNKSDSYDEKSKHSKSVRYPSRKQCVNSLVKFYSNIQHCTTIYNIQLWRCDVIITF